MDHSTNSLSHTISKQVNHQSEGTGFTRLARFVAVFGLILSVLGVGAGLYLGNIGFFS